MAAIAETGTVGAALEILRTNGYCRLRPLEPEPLKPLAAFIAAYHLGDPVGPSDAWRPWKRHAAAKKEATVARKIALTISPSASPTKHTTEIDIQSKASRQRASQRNAVQP